MAGTDRDGTAHDPDEAARLERLISYDILDTPAEPSFDRLTRLATTLLEMPISAVSLIDSDRQWFKSSVGLDVPETPRDVAFCAHAMHEDAVMEVCDAAADPRFADNPLVTGDFGLRYYAGAPLRTADGTPLGALCVIDRKPRRLTQVQRTVLADLAATAVDAMDLRKALKTAAEREAGMKQAQADLTASENRQRTILDTAVDAILTIDGRGNIRSVNPATCAMFGFTQEEMIGHNVSMLMPAAHAGAHDGYIHDYHRTGKPGIIGIGREVPARRKDGTVFPSELTISEMRLDGERFYTGIIRDISYRRSVEDSLREKNRLLGLAEEVAEVGHWRVTRPDRSVTWSDGMYRIHGWSREDFWPTVEGVMATIAADDQPAVELAVSHALETRGGFSIKYRMTRPDGAERVVSSTGRCEPDSEGGVAALFGVVQDVTEQVMAERRLRESEERLKLAIGHISDGFVLMDAADRVVVWNDKMLSLYPRIARYFRHGIPFEELVRRGLADGQYVNGVGREEEFVAERMAHHRMADEEYEERLIDAEGRERWVRVAERAIPGGGRVGIRVDITELREAQRAADKANRAKSEFLSSMSHELRTPLNAILGFAQLLEAGRKDSLTDRQKSHVQHILKGGQHLLDLINEVLDLARIEAGKLMLSMETIAAADVLEGCLPIAETLAGPRNITVRAEWRGTPPLVRADFTRLKQVLLNLLSNAVKYNRPGGSVTVTVGPSPEAGRMARFAISDTGPGIAPEMMDRLFEPFNRLGAETTDVEGTGIGLTLTRKLTEHMGGRIGVDSAVGVGTTFWVDLPLADLVAREVDAAADGAVETEPARQAAMRVLYVEDNPANMRLMQDVVEDMGDIELITAHNAELGLQLAAAELPDLIILDVNLPGMDGFEAVRRVRADPVLSAIPTIALSANATAGAIRQGQEAGFDAYLTKPVVVVELMRTIDNLVAARTTS